MTTVKEILDYLGLDYTGVQQQYQYGDMETITGVAPLSRAGIHDMTFRTEAHKDVPTIAGLVLTRLQFAKAAWKFFPPGPPTVTVDGNPMTGVLHGSMVDNISPTAVVAGETFANEQGIRMPSWAGVTIGKNVWIGHLACVDRGMFYDTVIEDDTKIDNQVIIGHNVHVGKRCVITAGALVGGSATIGDDVFIGLHATIRDHVKVGNRAVIGMGAVVLRDVEAGTTVVGNPAWVLYK